VVRELVVEVRPCTGQLSGAILVAVGEGIECAEETLKVPANRAVDRLVDAYLGHTPSLGRLAANPGSKSPGRGGQDSRWIHLSQCSVIGYLFSLLQDGGRARLRSRCSGCRSLIGCPCWLCGSHLACAVPCTAQGGERLKRGLHGSK